MKYILTLCSIFILNIHAEKTVIPQAKCSDIDVRDQMDVQMKNHFSTPRNQDGVGWCYAFAAADLMSVEMNKPLSATHVSAIFNKKVDDSFFMRMSYGIGRMFSDGAFEKSYEGGWVDRALENASDTKVVCTEEALPFDMIYNGQTKETISSLESIKRMIKNDQVTVQTCEELEYLRDSSFKNLGLLEIYALLEKENINQALAKMIKDNCRDDLIRLKKIDAKSISKPHRSHSQRDRQDPFEQRMYKKRVAKYFDKIGNVLADGKPLGISYNVKHIMSQGGGHASVLIGRRWKNGKCQFNIRNSWGRGCNVYDSNKIEDCNYEDGSYWVSDEKLFDMATDIDYIGG